jgi:FCD domain
MSVNRSCAGVGAFPADDNPHALRPAGQVEQAGELGNPGAVADLTVAVIGRGSRRAGILVMACSASVGDPGRFTLENVRFYRLISEATGNDVVIAVSAALSELFFKETVNINYSESALRATVRAHTRIVKALSERDSEVARGGRPGCCIGLANALRMITLGKAGRLSAEDAPRISLVSEVVAPDHLLDRARELAAEAAKASPDYPAGSGGDGHRRIGRPGSELGRYLEAAHRRVRPSTLARIPIARSTQT